jgi:hypothetical protein
VAHAEVTRDTVHALSALEPFGECNEAPTFLTRGMMVASMRPTSSGEHMQLTLKSEAGFVPCIAFGMVEKFCDTTPGSMVDAVFRPYMDSYNGVTRLKWQIRDCSVSDLPAAQPSPGLFSEPLPV